MQQSPKRSKISAVLQTTVFFAAIAAVIIAAFYWLGDKPTDGKNKIADYQAIDINDLADFNYKEPSIEEMRNGAAPRNEQFPESILKLNGKKVAITGFMMPVRVDPRGYVEEFALNGNYDMCFYGAPSRLNQWVHVRMEPNAKAKFSHSPTTVFGTLEVGELVQNGHVVSLYRLAGDRATTPSKGLF